MTNYSRVSFYTFDGKYINDLQTRTRRSWVRNDAGSATMWISPLDPKYSDRLLAIGNLVLIEHDRLPVWCGELTAPQSYDEGEITISARGALAITKLRTLMQRTIYSGSSAAIVNQLIGDANAIADMYYREGDVADTVKEARIRGKYQSAFAILGVMIERLGGDFWVTPFFDQNGQLRFRYNYGPAGGPVFNDHPILVEGQNIEAGNRPVMTIQSDPINSVIAVNAGLTDGGTLVGRAEDAESIGSIGLRQTKIDSAAITQEKIDQEAADFLTANRRGVRLFNVIALNKSDLFNYLTPGTVMPIELSSVGKDADGKRGISTYVKVNGVAYDDMENTAPLTVEEFLR